MRKKQIPPRSYLASCLSYDAETGSLTWKDRPASHFKNAQAIARWKTMYVGRPALNNLDSDGYLCGSLTYNGDKYRYRAHRIIYKIMTGEEPDIIDHADGNPANNAWDNLRAVSRAENARNVNSTRAIAGRWVRAKRNGTFEVRVSDRAGRRVQVGTFRSEADAREAAHAFAVREHGDFVSAHLRV